MNRFLTTTEVGEALGLSPDRVLQMIEEGIVKATRPHPRGHYRIRVEELERLEREAQQRVAG